MNINTGINPYNSNFVNTADRTKMSQSQSLTGSITDTLKEGEVFEGSVNSIENGKVTIGLANGQTMTARLDSGVSITPGQSVFFEVKSNDGNLVQIRPVSLNVLEANPTLLKALDMANLAVSERTINMVNSMMQNSMSISPENLASMNRAMINNPDVDMQTLVTMSKHGMELTPDNVNMFQNYVSDKAVITDNFDVISESLPELMTSEELTASDVININNAIRDIFIPENEINNISTNANVEDAGDPVAASLGEATETAQNQPTAENVLSEEPKVASNNILNENELIQTPAESNVQVLNNPIEVAEESVVTETTVNANMAVNQETAIESEASNNTLINNFASEKDITSFNTLLNNLPDFPKENTAIFTENGNLRADADINQVFKEITDYMNNNQDIPKETLNDIIREPLYKGLLKSIITNSFAMEPKDITKPSEISKLYERIQKQTEALERLVSQINNKSADAIKNQANEIRQNIIFMNSANEMYNFVQIPLKMYNQNTDSMLYVRQNKKSSYEQGEEITAFLHFDMEYLGSTDVFISLKESNVGCNWNLASEESMQLIEDNLDLLTERLAAKGFNVTSQVKCGEPKADFEKDFLGEKVSTSDTVNDGLVHRYSFDMRA